MKQMRKKTLDKATESLISRAALAGTPDENVIVALTFVFTLMYVAIRILLEVLYVFLDPRVRYTD